MVCPNCNKNIPDNIIFCPLCGGITGGIPKPPNPFQGTAVQQADCDTSNNNYTYVNGQPYSASQQNYTKKKMGVGKKLGIVLGGAFGILVLVVVIIALYSSGGPSTYKPNTFDFVLSGTYDEYGREIVNNLNGDRIGFVFKDGVYIPVEKGYIIVCEKNGEVIGRTDETLSITVDSYETETDGGDIVEAYTDPTKETTQSTEPVTYDVGGYFYDNIIHFRMKK